MMLGQVRMVRRQIRMTMRDGVGVVGRPEPCRDDRRRQGGHSEYLAVIAPLPPGSEIHLQPGKLDHGEVTLRIEEERLRRMKRENDIAEGKLVPTEIAPLPPGTAIEFPDLRPILARHEEALDSIHGMLKAMTPKPVSWNEVSG